VTAVWLQRFRAPRELFQTFAGVLLFVTVGVLAVIGVMSFIDAAVVVLTGFVRGATFQCHSPAGVGY